MAGLPWSEEYKTNDSVVDAHHRTLLLKIDDLFVAAASQNHESILDEQLCDIEGYAQYHFNAEEELMQSAGYPGLGRHRGEHELCLRKLRELITMHHSGALNLGRGVPKFLARWFTEHINSEDKGMVQWIRAQGGALAGSGYWAIRESGQLPKANPLPSKDAQK